MGKKTEARLTDQEGAQAPAARDASNRKTASREAIAATATRHGSDEAPRDTDDDLHEDERDRTDELGMTDAEYLALFQDSINQSVLPDIPKIPGYHTFWATTTNSRDTIASRLRMGYTFITNEELRGWEGGTIKTGDYAGCVGINEMVAMKIPTRLYQMYMTEVHHKAPLAEEEKIRATAQGLQESAAREKGRIEDDEGFMDNIVQKAPVPQFA